jgi:amino acid adenylation domain-containing protein
VIIDLVRATVRRSPDDIAVLTRDGSVTYQELWQQAGRVAQRLRDLGAGPEETVGVLARQSLDGVVAILAVLRLGAAYLGSCPSLPTARINTMVEDSGTRFVLHAGDLPADITPAPEYVDVRRVWDAAHGPAGPEVPEPPGPHPLAPLAVIYTSGSTGEPKGVVIPQRALLNRITWGQRTYPLTTGDRVLHHTRYIYDFSAWEVLAPLCYGATLVVDRFRNYPDFEELATAIRDLGATAVHFVPSVLAGVVRRESFRSAGSVTTVFSGGEALPRRLAEDVAKACEGAVLYNQYGPTEAAVDAAFFRYDPAGFAAGGTVPIGVPIDATRLYVLDEHLRPVSEGDIGELYIAGAGLALGYHTRPGLTAERFTADPFHDSGERMYRTGDLVTRLPGDLLAFVGRADWQINLRGVRLEPTEIELALQSHPAVARAVALVVGDDDQHLVAWIVPEDGGAVTREDLRALVLSALPAAAVPDRFVLGESVPLLPNGKVDRRAVRDLVAQAAPLPTAEPGTDTPDSGTPDVPDELAVIWRELLGVGESAPHTDFFEAGGHSLLAVEMVSVINERLGADIQLAEFFEQATLACLAELLRGSRAMTRWDA